MVALKGYSRTSRRAELRRILGSAPRQKGRVHALRQYVARHRKGLLAGLVLAIALGTQVYYFNVLTTMQQNVSNLRSQIESGLQMRQNIVPSLTVAVNRFLTYEKGLFLSAVNAREKSLSMSEDMDKLIQSLKGISGSEVTPSDLSRFMAVAENYPQLVSIESYKLLIAQIAEVENQVYSKRVEYNDVVRIYNTCLCRFPANMAGGMMGFHSEPYFVWDNKPEWSFSEDSDGGEPRLKMESEESGMGG